MENETTEKGFIIDNGGESEFTGDSSAELLLYLQDDLLPGLNELLIYAESLDIDPHAKHGLTSRIEVLRDDLKDRLAP